MSIAFGVQGAKRGVQRNLFNPQTSHAGGPSMVPGAAEGWKPCAQTAEALAANVDHAINWLKNEAAVVQMSYVDESGNHGMSHRTVQIKSSRVFRLEFPSMDFAPTGKHSNATVISAITAIADGTNLAYLNIDRGSKKIEPIATAKLAYSVPLGEWPTQFPRLVLSAVDGGKPFEALVAGARSSAAKVSMAVEERRFDFKGEMLHQERLTIQSKNPKSAPILFQAVFDASRYLPNTIVGITGPIAKPVRAVFWSAAWGRVTPDKFKKDAFIIPRHALTVAKAVG